MSNIIDAIANVVRYRNNSLLVNSKGNNRANNMGYGLEEFVKDMFAGTFGQKGEQRLLGIQQVFSYLGNNSNPPDAILRDGDAIEVKKIESPNSSLALNSSHPKHKLNSQSPMISKACRNAENWNEKDIIYIVGFVQNARVRRMAMVYGIDYCADESCYLKLKNAIKHGVEELPDIEFAESRELGHINRVDPLGITYMRVRGMWGIENPWKAFDYVLNTPNDVDFSMECIIRNEKWNSFGNKEDLVQLAHQTNDFSITDVRIKDPDNPARLNKAKLITFSF